MFKVPTPTVKKTVRRSLAVSKVNSILKGIYNWLFPDCLYQIFSNHTLVDWLVVWLIDVMYWFSNDLLDWLTDWLIDCFITTCEFRLPNLTPLCPSEAGNRWPRPSSLPQPRPLGKIPYSHLATPGSDHYFIHTSIMQIVC